MCLVLAVEVTGVTIKWEAIKGEWKFSTSCLPDVVVN